MPIGPAWKKRPRSASRLAGTPNPSNPRWATCSERARIRSGRPGAAEGGDLRSAAHRPGGAPGSGPDEKLYTQELSHIARRDRPRIHRGASPHRDRPQRLVGSPVAAVARRWRVEEAGAAAVGGAAAATIWAKRTRFAWWSSGPFRLGSTVQAGGRSFAATAPISAKIASDTVPFAMLTDLTDSGAADRLGTIADVVSRRRAAHAREQSLDRVPGRSAQAELRLRLNGC